MQHHVYICMFLPSPFVDNIKFHYFGVDKFLIMLMTNIHAIRIMKEASIQSCHNSRYRRILLLTAKWNDSGDHKKIQMEVHSEKRKISLSGKIICCETSLCSFNQKLPPNVVFGMGNTYIFFDSERKGRPLWMASNEDEMTTEPIEKKSRNCILIKD